MSSNKAIFYLTKITKKVKINVLDNFELTKQKKVIIQVNVLDHFESTKQNKKL